MGRAPLFFFGGKKNKLVIRLNAFGSGKKEKEEAGFSCFQSHRGKKKPPHNCSAERSWGKKKRRRRTNEIKLHRLTQSSPGKKKMRGHTLHRIRGGEKGKKKRRSNPESRRDLSRRWPLLSREKEKKRKRGGQVTTETYYDYFQCAKEAEREKKEGKGKRSSRGHSFFPVKGR